MESNYLWKGDRKNELKGSLGFRRQVARKGGLQDSIVNLEELRTEFEALHGESIYTRGLLYKLLLKGRPYSLIAASLVFSGITFLFSYLFLRVFPGSGSSGPLEYYQWSAGFFGAMTSFGILSSIAICFSKMKFVFVAIVFAMCTTLLNLAGSLIFFMFGMHDPKLMSSDTYLFTSVICLVLLYGLLKIVRVRTVWEKIAEQLSDEKSQR